MHRSRNLGAVAALALVPLAVALTGCGGSNGAANGNNVAVSGSQSATKCGMATGKPATGTPIQVRALVTASGGVNFSSAALSAAAFFKCVNANGGVHGHPIKYAWEDDGLNLPKAAQIASQYAADKSIVALAGDATFIGCGVANPIYRKADLYSITGTGVPESCYHSSNIATVNAGPRSSAVATIEYLNSIGKAARVVQVSNTVPGVGDWLQAGADAYAKAHGAKVVKSILHDPANFDATSIVLQIKNANPTAVILEDPAPVSAAILKAAATQGLQHKFVWTCLSSCYDASFPGQIGPTWDGFISNSELQLVDANTPDNVLWRAVLQKYGSSQDPRDTFGQSGFLAAKILTDTLLKLNPADITRATVSNAILGIRDYKSDILCTPWYYGRASEHAPNHTTRMAVAKNGAYVQLQGCTPVNDPGLAPVIQQERSQGLAG